MDRFYPSKRTDAHWVSYTGILATLCRAAVRERGPGPILIVHHISLYHLMRKCAARPHPRAGIGSSVVHLPGRSHTGWFTAVCPFTGLSVVNFDEGYPESSPEKREVYCAKPIAEDWKIIRRGSVPKTPSHWEFGHDKVFPWLRAVASLEGGSQGRAPTLAPPRWR